MSGEEQYTDQFHKGCHRSYLAGQKEERERKEAWKALALFLKDLSSYRLSREECQELGELKQNLRQLGEEI